MPSSGSSSSVAATRNTSTPANAWISSRVSASFWPSACRASICSVGQQELAAFLKRLSTERRLSPHTVTAYTRDVQALLSFCAREKIEQLSALDSHAVRRFAADSHRKGLGARSVARRLSAVRTVLNYLIEVGVVKANAGV